MNDNSAKNKVKIIKLAEDHPGKKYGYNYNLQCWTSVDGGKSYGYCGNGRFCKNRKELRKYKKYWLEPNKNSKKRGKVK